MRVFKTLASPSYFNYRPTESAIFNNSSALKIRASGSSEMLIPIYRLHNVTSQKTTVNIHRRQNLGSQRLGNLHVYVQTILKWGFKELGMRVWTGFNWLWIRSCGGLL
jgi:hypothetical protein